jgi:hypothetical protein
VEVTDTGPLATRGGGRRWCSFTQRDQSYGESWFRLGHANPRTQSDGARLSSPIGMQIGVLAPHISRGKRIKGSNLGSSYLTLLVGVIQGSSMRVLPT